VKSVPGIGAGRPRSAVLAYLSCIRYPDVLVLQGSPLLGAAFALREPSLEAALAGSVFALAGFLLVAHVWTLNDWANVATDRENPTRAERVFSTKGVSSRGLLGFSVGLLLASLLVLALLSPLTALIGAAIAALGVVYSHPAFCAKSIPVVSSVPHVLGGLLHFLLGYSVFAAVDARGVLIGGFFALTFTAGHLNQEVRDHAGDRRSGLKTNAVYFGPRSAFLAGLAVFSLAYADLALLAWYGLVPPALGIVAALLYPVHLVLSVRALRAGLGFETVSRLQRGYRTLYALIGLAMLGALVLR